MLSRGEAAPSSEYAGIPFCVAVRGSEFWLIWFVAFAILGMISTIVNARLPRLSQLPWPDLNHQGAGNASNQNLAFVLESAADPDDTGLAVGLFALTSTVVRVAVGIVSDKFATYSYAACRWSRPAMKSSVNFRCQHILSRVSMIPIVSASALVSQCLLALPNISSIMLGVFFSALSFGGFLTLFLPVLNEMYALLPLGKSSTTLPSGALTPAGTADVSLVSYAACSLSARPSPPFASRSSSCPAYTKPRQHGTAPSLASGPTATRLILALSRRHLVKS